MWAVWGAPTHPTQYVSLLGSFLMVLASYASLFRLRPAAWIALVGSLSAWTFYGPALVITSRAVLDGSQLHRSGALVFAASAVTLLVVATIHALAAAAGKRENTRLFPVEASRRLRIVIGVFTLLACVGIGAATVLHFRETSRRPSRYLIPNDYVGWVEIHFEVKGATALPVEDGFYLFKFSRGCILKTSSSLESGWARDEYYYYDDAKRQPLPVTGWDGGGAIWAQSTGTSSDANSTIVQIHERFFVGTEAQFRSNDPHAEPRDCDVGG